MKWVKDTPMTERTFIVQPILAIGPSSVIGQEVFTFSDFESNFYLMEETPDCFSKRNKFLNNRILKFSTPLIWPIYQ